VPFQCTLQLNGLHLPPCNPRQPIDRLSRRATLNRTLKYAGSAVCLYAIEFEAGMVRAFAVRPCWLCSPPVSDKASRRRT